MKHKIDEISERDRGQKKGITRRTFVGSAIASPLAAQATVLPEQQRIFQEETDLDFVVTDEVVSVSIRQSIDTARRAYWQKLRVLETEPPAETVTEPVLVWQVARARFGPDATFSLRATESNGLKRYKLSVRNLRYGRVANRRIIFTFQQRQFEDSDGQALFDQIAADLSSYDAKTAKLVAEYAKKPVPKRKVFTLSVSTDVWSLSGSATARRGFTLEPQEEVADAVTGGALRFRRWINSEKVENGPLGLVISAGRVTSTMRLVFNGQIGFDRRHAKRLTQLRLDHRLKWYVETRAVRLWALSPDIRLDDLSLHWSVEADDDRSRGTPAGDGEDLAEPVVLPDRLELARSVFGLTGVAAVAGDVSGVAFKGSKGDPGLDLQLATNQALKVRLRVLEEGNVDDGRLTPGMMRSEAALLANWQRFSLTGSKAVAAGPFEGLRGRLLERVEAPVAMNRLNYARSEGNISFGANFTGPASRHWRVVTPIGPIGFRGPEEDEPVSGESAFAPRRGDQVQVVYRWQGWNTSNPVRRNAPRADWVEVNGVLREAAVELPDASSARLTFAPTSLALVFSPVELPPPLNSYIRLGAPKGSERAQLDLGRAALRASRADDLLYLTFRFQDFGLSFTGDTLELVRKNAACLLTPSPDGNGRPHDTRPVLAVEFPGQHILEEAFFAPVPPEPPDVEIKVNKDGQTKPHAALTVDTKGLVAGEALAGADTPVRLTRTAKGHWRFDPNDRLQVTELLRLFKNVGYRKALRETIRDAKKSAGGGGTPAQQLFEKQVTAYTNKLTQSNLQNLPTDQTVYIGPFALDPDAMRVSEIVWSKARKEVLTGQIGAMFNAVETEGQRLIEAAKNRRGVEVTPLDRRVRMADTTFDGALALEQMLEAQFPSYQLYRSAYRDAMIATFEETVAGGGEEYGPVDLLPEHIEAVHSTRLGKAALPVWAAQMGANASQFKARHDKAMKFYFKQVQGTEPVNAPARARLAPPSRLAFRVRCRDGLSEVRTKVETLDTPANAPAELVRPSLPLTLEALTRFSDFELSVTARSEAVYRPGETGRLDAASARRLDTSQSARLDHLGYTDGDFVTSDTRLGNIADSLRKGPTQFETAIELARLTLSPDQNAAVIANDGFVPAGVYADAGERRLAATAMRLFSARFLVDEVDPNLRVVASPDLRPDVFEARFDKKSDGGRSFPGGAPPPRGPLAPWHLGPHQTQKQTLGEADAETIEPADLFARLRRYLTKRAKLSKAVTPRDLRFRAALDAYARHELVILSSAWGMPVLGKRDAAGAIVEGSSQAEAEARHRLIDVKPGSAIYVPQTLGTSELSLGTLGLTLRHASSFSTPAAAFDVNNRALFPALSVESWQQWTNLGRDIHCEVVYKGYLWPIGQSASLVQVTERKFDIDHYGAIRAVLKQRMFIRVGKAEKIFPALKQPAQGRRFPVERLVNLTGTTPDIVDPSDTPMPSGARPGLVLANGRINPGDGAQGLVFWPRTAKLTAANIRFELDLDGTRTTLPLVFVDNVAANDPITLERLSLYYNSIDAPDSILMQDPQQVYDPLRHLRTLDMGGGKRRYAPELEAGSASVETMLWTLCATGLSQSPATPPNPTGKAELLPRSDVIYRSDPLLQGADQPPFYPALECARIRPRQAERLVGRPLSDKDGTTQDVRFLRAAPDARYVAQGLPDGTAVAAAGVADVVPGNEAEVYLSMIDQPALDMGSKGDNSGGVFRPSGRLVALSRSRGVMTWAKRELVTDGLTKPSEDLPTEPEDIEKALLHWCNQLVSMAPLMSMTPATAVATGGGTAVTVAADGQCSKAETTRVSTELTKGLEQARKIYSDLFDGNAKILGLISIKDLFKFIENLDPPSTGAPQLAEQVQYGAAGVQEALGEAKKQVDGGLDAINAAAETARLEVIVPLSGAVTEIRDGWDELDREIQAQVKKVPGGVLGGLSFASIFPELHCALAAFEAALARAAAAADALAFALASSEVFSAGRRFLDALFRAASDPGRRIAAAVSSGIDEILALFSNLDKQRNKILMALLEEYLGENAKDILKALKIAEWIAVDGSEEPPTEITEYVQQLVAAFTPDLQGGYPVIFLPGVDDPLAAEIKFSGAELRGFLTALLVALIEARGKVDLETVLFAMPEPDGAIATFWQGVTSLFGADSPQPVAVLIAREALNKINEAIKALEDATPARPVPAALTDAQLFLTRVSELWENRDSNQRAFQRQWRHVQPRLLAWITAGFAREWQLIEATERHVRTIIGAIDRGDLATALPELRALIELHFGPLNLPIDAAGAICTKVLRAIASLLKALLPPFEQLNTLKAGLDAGVTHLAGWNDKLNSAVAAASSKLDGDDVQDALKKLALDERANGLVGSLSDIKNDTVEVIVNVSEFATQLSATIERDKAALINLHNKVSGLGAAPCTADTFTSLKGTYDQLRQFIELRRIMVLSLSEGMNDLVVALDVLLVRLDENEKELAVLGVLAALGGVATEALAKLEAGNDDELVKKFKKLKADIDEIAKGLFDERNAYAQQIAENAASALTYLQEQMQAIVEELNQSSLPMAEYLPRGAAQLQAELQVPLSWLRTHIDVFENIAMSDKAFDDLRTTTFTDPAGNGLSALDVFRAELQGLTMAEAVAAEQRVVAALTAVQTKTARYFLEVRDELESAANQKIKAALKADLPVGDITLPGFYGQILRKRDEIYDSIVAGGTAAFGTPLLLSPLNRGAVGNYVPSASGGDLTKAKDQLAGDVAWLRYLADNDIFGDDSTKGAKAFVGAFIDEWTRLEPTPVVIGTQVVDIFREILRGDIFAAIDFQYLRRQVEDYILSLVPTETTMSFDYGVELGSNVKDATGGIFAPGPGTKLTVGTEIKIDLSGVVHGDTPSVNAQTTGRLGPFDVKLVGDAFDALTLKFNGATFRAENGKKFEFDIEYSDFEIGPMLEFVQQFQSFLTPKGDSGFFLWPVTSPSFGIEAGYILNLGDFTVGAMAISNVGLASSAILPFDSGDARFRASLSTRLSPFTITYLPYGGSGFFGIEANANGIKGFEASFEFGGSAVFAFGPLSGQGRLMSGFYIRMSVGDNGQKLTELSATVFVGGSASIWIFSFAAALSVRLGMVNGDMSGEAIFSFSFSMGFADYEYSITMFKKEAKGFNGQDSASLFDSPFGREGVRIAQLGNFGRSPLQSLGSDEPRIDRTTVCQSRDWTTYSSYFRNTTPEDVFA